MDQNDRGALVRGELDSRFDARRGSSGIRPLQSGSCASQTSFVSTVSPSCGRGIGRDHESGSVVAPMAAGAQAARFTATTPRCSVDEDQHPVPRRDSRRWCRRARDRIGPASARRRSGLGRVDRTGGRLHLPAARRSRSRSASPRSSAFHSRTSWRRRERRCAAARSLQSTRSARPQHSANRRRPSSTPSSWPWARVRSDAVAGALTFRGPADGPALAAVLEQATAGTLRRIAFVVPAGISWPLPLYELALLTGNHLTDSGTRGVELVIVTAEEHPLGVFGREASAAIARAARDSRHRAPGRGCCDRVAGRRARGRRGTSRSRRTWLLRSPSSSAPHSPGSRTTAAASSRPTPRAVSPGRWTSTQRATRRSSARSRAASPPNRLMRLQRQSPSTPARTCEQCRFGRSSADCCSPASCRAISARTLRAGTSVIDTEALWWPPAKIVGRHLAPFLAAQLGLTAALPEHAKEHAVEVEVELDPRSGSQSSV